MKNRNSRIPIGMLISLALVQIQCNGPTNETKPLSIKTHSISTPDTISIEQKDTVANVKLQHVALHVTINNLKSETAPVVVAIYKTHFPYIKGKIKEYKFIPKGKVLHAIIKDLKYGTYAISIYQDTNLSGKFDKNILGLPKEPYAFSNNFVPKIKVPTFDECKFVYDFSSHVVITDLIH